MIVSFRVELDDDRRAGRITFEKPLSFRPDKLVLCPLMAYEPSDLDMVILKNVLQSIWILLKVYNCVATLEPRGTYIQLTKCDNSEIEPGVMIDFRWAVIQAMYSWGLSSSEISITTRGIPLT